MHDTDPEVPVDDEQRARLVMTVVAESLDPAWLATVPTPTHVPRLSPPAFRRRLTTAARAADRRIVLPEGAEPRTLQAAAACQERGIARCVLLAPPEEVAAVAAGLGLTLPAGLEVVDPRDPAERYVDALVTARRHKGLTPDTARDLLTDPITLGTMMLHLDEVDGLVAGAVHTTAATLRPALQVIGTAPKARLVSSVFFMCLPDDVVIYGDCAVNPDPDAEQLADIAVQSAASARAFGIEPRVAMISFSTGSSGAGTDVQKVADATELVRILRADARGRRAAAVRRGRDRLGGAEQGAGQPGRRSGHGLRLPRPEHRQHDIQGRAAQRRRAQHRTDAAGARQAGERPVPWRARRGHRLHDCHHGDPGGTAHQRLGRRLSPCDATGRQADASGQVSPPRSAA